MRLTQLGNRLMLAAALMGCVGPAAGCRRTPYIDQAKEVPQETLSLAAERDDQVQAAQFLEHQMALPLPRVADPRTTSDPETQEVWRLPLDEAIRIGLENSEVIRVIALGAQGIPVGGFEPAPLASGAGAALGSTNLATVYDNAIAETQIPLALSAFDTNLVTQLTWGHSSQPFNNAIQAGFFSGNLLGGPKFPVVFDQDTAQFAASIQKRAATGATMGITQNVSYLYSNSPTNVFPSAYTSNLQLQFTQPLLGSAPLAGNQISQFGPAGLEANRAPIVISRLNADASVWRFKNEVMQMVRSIEQQYWTLAQQQVRLWSAETAFELSEKLLEDVLANQEVGSRRGSRRDLADAQVQVENARLQLVTATSDVLTTERQLRNILGLPPADNRRIVPVTEPTDAASTTRLGSQPRTDGHLPPGHRRPPVAGPRRRASVAHRPQHAAAGAQLQRPVPVQRPGPSPRRVAEGHDRQRHLTPSTRMLQLQQRAAGLNAVPTNYNNFQTWQLGFTFQMPLGFRGPLANVRSSQYSLLQQRAFLQQTVHDRTHALARFFLEVDANFKQYRAASRLKDAAFARLDYNKARYDAGDRDPSRSEEAVTIQALIASINQWTDAIAQEALYKSTYNTSLAVLEEAKGTLLSYNNIALAEGPWPRQAYIQAQDQQEAHRQHPIGGTGPYAPIPSNGPATPDPVTPMPPPNLGPARPRPAMPAPAGPLPPAPHSVPPQVPAGDPTILGSRSSNDPAVSPASVMRTGRDNIPAPALPQLPTARPEPTTTALVVPNDGGLASHDGPTAIHGDQAIGEVPAINLPPLPRD